MEIKTINDYNIYNYGLAVKKTNIINLENVKIASFDIDYTIIKTKSGNTFPISYSDWELMYDNTASILKQYNDQGYIIVFFTNQKKLNDENIVQFIGKLESIRSILNIDFACYVSYFDNGYRKPMTGMFNKFLLDHNIVSINIKDSFYCGDAAGRTYIGDKKKDHNITDYYFAKNIGLKFITPENVFNKIDNKYYIEDKYTNLALNIWLNKEPLPWSKISDFNNKNGPKIIQMVGCPASGKSSLSRLILKRFPEYNYILLNSDTHKHKLSKMFLSAVSNQNNIIIDNTNPSNEIREKYFNEVPTYNKLIIYFDFPKDLCLHLNNYRTQRSVTKEKISKLVYNIYYKKLDIPQNSNDINVINIRPSMIVPKIKHKEFMYFYDI
jgi:bifunctional polynucleotide phosphatase/kinase